MFGSLDQPDGTWWASDRLGVEDVIVWRHAKDRSDVIVILVIIIIIVFFFIVEPFIHVKRRERLGLGGLRLRYDCHWVIFCRARCLGMDPILVAVSGG